MRQSQRIKRILREQWGHPHTGDARNWPPRRATSLTLGAALQPPSNGLEVTEHDREESMTGLTLSFIRSA